MFNIVNSPTDSYHDQALVSEMQPVSVIRIQPKFTYTFANFFHPFVGQLIARLNRYSLTGLFDAGWQQTLAHPFFAPLYQNYLVPDENVEVLSSPKAIDVGKAGPYAGYNWELFFHIPLMIAVHLSKTQRFAEAQRWFHYIFDPTANDPAADPLRFWKFLAFRDSGSRLTVDEIVRLLSTPRAGLNADEQSQQASLLEDYTAILENPFQPHRVARTRPIAYQYTVVMKYLDNLIAWGDHLFQQDTVESINEATQRYVLAANILGPRPQRIPPAGIVQPKTFAQLKAGGLGPIGNALVDLESQFPFNQSAPAPAPSSGAGESSALFGIGRTLYFCIPHNDKLLGYWDRVADRLFKIRHCMNIAGVVRSLALFDPPIDPGMLVKAAAAGLDVGSIVSGMNQPVGPVRCLLLIQKALELCGEVRGLGGALLSALEKGDGERLALVRQRHEVQIQQMAQEVRFLQWKSAQEATTSLLTSRATALERLRFYQRVLGLPADPNAPESIALDRRALTEENFDEAYSALVGQYEKALTLQALPALRIAGGTSPAQQSGASGPGGLRLNTNEDVDLNEHAPAARDFRYVSTLSDSISQVLALMPDFGVDIHFWGLGANSKIIGGSTFAAVGRSVASYFTTRASNEESHGASATKTAGYERRADDWLLQHNLAARELMQIGRQILTSLIAEQIAHHEYLNIQQQIANAQEVDQFLHDKFTNEDLYLWMQGEISRLYYEYYRFAFDTARKAERTMKQELMRPELDAQDFVKFNYWDGGRKGLLSGEALYLDVKRMEMAYHEHNRREFELTRHVSLRQLDPLALLDLKAKGTCQVTIPEWLYDRDCPGHYLRRIKSVGLSLPSVAGPYTSVNCTLSLLRSSLRKSTLLKNNSYERQGPEDDRFVDYAGGGQMIVTSGANQDSGMFETNLRDERFLPFEGAGAVSTWELALPNPDGYPVFDYATISDAILHIRYTARQGVLPGPVTAALGARFAEASQSNLALLFSLRHDFPTEWSAFVNGPDEGSFTALIHRDYFPYFTQGKMLTIVRLAVLDGESPDHPHELGDLQAVTEQLQQGGHFALVLQDDVLTRTADGQFFLVVQYTLGV